IPIRVADCSRWDATAERLPSPAIATRAEISPWLQYITPLLLQEWRFHSSMVLSSRLTGNIATNNEALTSLPVDRWPDGTCNNANH
ncbi:MAG: hypothetical protein ACREXO_09140, partial [Advenella sp.]